MNVAERLADVTERGFWDDYMAAYEDCLGATSKDEAPWYIVPADDKKNARLIISQVVLDTLGALHPAYPETTAERRRELAMIREQLEAEAPKASPPSQPKQKDHAVM